MIEQQPRTVRRRGIGFLWFALVVVPFFFAGSALAFDGSRLLLAKREASNAAQAAAVAAATQFSAAPGREDTVTPASARTAALETIIHARDTGALRVAQVNPAQTVTLISADATQVTVTVEFRVTGMAFLGYFVSGGQSTSARVSSTAFVCIPDTRGVDGRFCRRPGA
jgi:Flp pilus assembly protein TadG